MSAVILDNWEDQTNLGILAISSHLEDYQFAFTLNRLFKTHLKNTFYPTNIRKRGRLFNYSVYKSTETKITPTLYFIDNQSIQESGGEEINTLFNSNIYIQSPLIESLKKWHYIMISSDINWLENISSELFLNNFTYTLMIDIQSLKKNEQSILYSITYD